MAPGYGNYNTLNTDSLSMSNRSPWLTPTPNSNLYGNNQYSMNSFMNSFSPSLSSLPSTTTATTTTNTKTNTTSTATSSHRRKFSTLFKGLTKDEEKIALNLHAKSNEYIENLGTSFAFGAGICLVLPNCRNVAHPFSAVKTAFGKKSATNVMFKEFIKNNPDLWKKEAGLLQNAYAAMQKTEVRAKKWKWQGIFKRGYKPIEYKNLHDAMATALRNGNTDEILEATAKLQTANQLKAGWWHRLFRTKKSKLGINSKLTPDAIATAKQTVQTTSNLSLKNCFKTSLGGKMGVLSAFASLFSDWQYISAAFKEDTNTGFKQLGQSVAKAGASWGGYLIGDAIGKWGGAKLGAMLGTAICPGLGTLVGAASGVILGTVASWGLRKIVNWAVGDNIANNLITKNKVKEAQADEQKASLAQEILTYGKDNKDLTKKEQAVIAKLQQIYGQDASQGVLG